MKVTLEAGYTLAKAVQFKEEAVKEAYCSDVSIRSLYDVEKDILKIVRMNERRGTVHLKTVGGEDPFFVWVSAIPIRSGLRCLSVASASAPQNPRKSLKILKHGAAISKSGGLSWDSTKRRLATSSESMNARLQIGRRTGLTRLCIYSLRSSNS
jgi:hypothetical protein